MKMRPIIGWRNPQWEFIVNPIFDAGFGSHTNLDFVPAARLARKLAEDTFVGVEYYTDLGCPAAFPLLTKSSINCLPWSISRSVRSMSISASAMG